MGLDMYLERMPRYRGVSVNEVNVLESYLGYINDCKNPNSNAKNYTLKEWCGVEEKDVISGDPFKFYQHFYNTKYSYWDREHKYGRDGIIEQVGYWRKANQIHNWFVENIQDGEDDCDYHREVTKEDLEELLDVCKRVLESCELVDGKIYNGYSYVNGQELPILEDGKYIKNPSVAQESLPATSGFFFGSTQYDEYYVSDIQETIDIITKVLETTDFETEMIYYLSSW